MIGMSPRCFSSHGMAPMWSSWPCDHERLDAIHFPPCRRSRGIRSTPGSSSRKEDAAVHDEQTVLVLEDRHVAADLEMPPRATMRIFGAFGGSGGALRQVGALHGLHDVAAVATAAATALVAAARPWPWPPPPRPRLAPWFAPRPGRRDRPGHLAASLTGVRRSALAGLAALPPFVSWPLPELPALPEWPPTSWRRSRAGRDSSARLPPRRLAFGRPCGSGCGSRS